MSLGWGPCTHQAWLPPTHRTGGHKACTLSSPAESLPDGQVIALCAILPLAAFEEVSFMQLNLVSGRACARVRTAFDTSCAMVLGPHVPAAAVARV